MNKEKVNKERKEFKELKKKADGGDAESQYYVAECYGYFNGCPIVKDGRYAIGNVGIEWNRQKAEPYYKLAALQGHPAAQYMMAASLCNGILGGEKDEKKGVKYLKLSADQGHVEAQYWLAECYYYSECGIERDCQKALYYYKLSAAQGHELANNMLKEVDDE